MTAKVQELSALARQHLEALHIGSKVTRWFRAGREANVMEVTPERVVATLHRVGINGVLMGTHGINGYRDQPRGTQDVDVLVTKKDVRKAVRILEETFPYLEVIENAAVARFLDPVTQKVVIDVMKPASRAMHAVFRNAIPIGDTHRIPDLETALASKFLAMIAPTRRPDKKLIDAGDFTNIVIHNRSVLDLKKLKRIGDQFHPQGGTEMVRLVGDIDAGRQIRL
jgi:hypothetical protein